MQINTRWPQRYSNRMSQTNLKVNDTSIRRNTIRALLFNRICLIFDRLRFARLYANKNKTQAYLAG